MGVFDKVVDVAGQIKNMVPGGASIRKPDHGEKGEHDPENNKLVGSNGGSGATTNTGTKMDKATHFQQAAATMGQHAGGGEKRDAEAEQEDDQKQSQGESTDKQSKGEGSKTPPEQEGKVSFTPHADPYDDSA